LRTANPVGRVHLIKGSLEVTQGITRMIESQGRAPEVGGSTPPGLAAFAALGIWVLLGAVVLLL
jgi:hypothetical protein